MDIKIVLCISLCQLVCSVYGMPNNGNCQAYKHERDLVVPGCETIRIPDRMCKGLCLTVVFPRLSKNHHEEIDVVLDGKSTKTCNMCLPRKYSQKTFTLRCKKEKKEEKKDYDLPWILSDPDEEEYEDRDHVIDILEECECKRCSDWKNRKKDSEDE